ncbi:MAG TPA: hypothetical protein VH165_26395 [Kofleriaceae bacterium]|jgi:hypothetical protein|nr:hypothetical protein [Kofleriaceae bacterium]
MTHFARTIGIATLAALAGGCVIHTTDRDGGGVLGDDVATISARWTLRNMADGAATVCPAGYDTVELIAQPVDDAGQPTGAQVVDLFDCNDGLGESTELAPGVYQAWIEVRSHDLLALYAQSLSQIFDVRKLNQTFFTDILNDGGYFQLSWALVGKTTGQPVDCADLDGLTTIHAISVNAADPERTYDDQLACGDHTAVTSGLLQGSYNLTINAEAAGVPAGGALTLSGQQIAGQNHITDLGLITIFVDGR